MTNTTMPLKRAFHTYCPDGFDDEQSHEIIFAKTSVEAKKIWSCDHWDGQEITGISARRKPEYDQFSPGPVPPLSLIDDGWQFECLNCADMVTGEYGQMPVNNGDWVFCSDKCMSNFNEDRRKTKRNERRVKNILRSFLLSKFPDAKPVYEHAYVQYDGNGWKVRQVFIDFKYPCAKFGKASIRIDTPYGNPEHKRGHIFMVPRGDVDHFNAWANEHGKAV